MSKFVPVKFNPLNDEVSTAMVDTLENCGLHVRRSADFTSDALILENNPPKSSSLMPIFGPEDLPSGKSAMEFVKYFDTDKTIWATVELSGLFDPDPEVADSVAFAVKLGNKKGHVFFDHDIPCKEDEAFQMAEELAERIDSCENLAEALLETFNSSLKIRGYEIYKTK